MALLPKTVDEFADETFWKKFFADRETNAFEWYGDFADLKTSLLRYIKPTDKILQVGCGNSLLADQLYDNGYHHVTSIDIVDEVITNQRKRNRKKRPELVFQQADVTKLPYDVETFNVILDKGTLDALLPDDSVQHVCTVNSMFDEINRCLTNGGRYLTISLAQEHILHHWISYFNKFSFILRVHQVPRNVQSKYQVFIFIATKLKPGVNFPKLYELISDSTSPPAKFSQFDGLLEAVKSSQQYGYICYKASASYLDEELRIKFYSAVNPGVPRYIIYVVQKIEDPKNGAPYAVFIVPQGRETHWHFTSVKGRQELCRAASCCRLAIVFLCRDQIYENLDQVKSELNGVVLDFAPEYLKNSEYLKNNVMYLSLGADYLGTRIIRQTYRSEINGDFVVEDVYSKDIKEALRRLVFLSNDNIVQSEIQLIDDGKGVSYGNLRDLDWNNLSCLHHRAVVAAIALSSENFIEADLRILLIGLGGGCLATYLRKHFSKASIVAIELDPTVVQSAKDWFEFVTDEKLTCIIQDGVDYLKKSAENGEHFDVVIFDVGGSSHFDGLTCPPPAFLTDECLRHVKSLVMPQGALAINLVCRDADKSMEIKSKVGDIFETVMYHGITDMVNHLLICLPFKPDDLAGFNLTVHSRLARLYEYLAEICKLKNTNSSNGVIDNEKKTNLEAENLDDMLEKLVNL